MVMLQTDNEVDGRAEINAEAGSRSAIDLAIDLRKIVGQEPGLAQPIQRQAAHWVYSVPTVGVRYYTYD